MRVAFLTPWDHPCGIADYSRHLVAALRLHADVHVVELWPRYRFGPFSALRHRTADLRYYRELADRLNEADLAHIQFQYPLFGGFAPWKLKFGPMMERVKVPIVLTLHELDYRRTRPSSPEGKGPAIFPGTTGMNFFERQHYMQNASIVTWPQIRAVIVHTRDFVEPLTELMVAREIVHVQPMPVPEIVPLPSVDEAKERLGLRGKRVLAILGFVVKRKGYEVALAALRELPQDVMLAIIGGPSEFDRSGFFEQFTARVDGSLYRSRVRITGYVQEDAFRDWVAAADVVLAPFEAMSGSSSLTLAIAAEKPIVASDLPGIREMCDCVPCMQTFPRHNHQELAAAARQVLDDSETRERLLRAVRTYKATFHVRQIAQATADVYRLAVQ